MSDQRRLPPDVHPETRSRLSPVRRDALDEEQRASYDAITQRRGLNLAGLQGPGGIWLRSPQVRKPIGDLNRSLRAECGLDPRLVEVAILATAREMQSEFEWSMHEPEALKHGVSQATIEAIRQRRPLAGVAQDEAALIELTREAIGDKRVSATTYARAVELFGEQALIHFSTLIGSYAMTAIVLSVFDQQLHDPVQA